jgi:putative transposase
LEGLIDEAVRSGARRARACAEAGITLRTLQRWRHEASREDRRPTAVRPPPGNRLSEAERAEVLRVSNCPEFASLPPRQIVPALADRSQYLASESSFYRVLRAHEQQHLRGRAAKPVRREPPRHVASGPNQLWCWDITWLPTTVGGKYFYWYMIEDIYSRKLVANEVYAEESSELAAGLLCRACLAEAIATAGSPLVLHSDNGSAMKGATMLATMQNLGVVPSFSRPRVSDDNPYAETLFRTAKYCPMWPERPFDTLEEARAWVQSFVDWYNNVHRHSGLKFVTPAERQRCEADAILARRTEVYEAARARNPARWSGNVRNWVLDPEVRLNRHPRKTTESAMVA